MQMFTSEPEKRVLRISELIANLNMLLANALAQDARLCLHIP